MLFKIQKADMVKAASQLIAFSPVLFPSSLLWAVVHVIADTIPVPANKRNPMKFQSHSRKNLWTSHLPSIMYEISKTDGITR